MTNCQRCTEYRVLMGKPPNVGTFLITSDMYRSINCEDCMNEAYRLIRRPGDLGRLNIRICLITD